MMQGQGGHAAKHAAGLRKTDIDMTKIGFSKEVLRRLTRLDALIRDSEHISPETREELRELASGQPRDVQTALWDMAIIAQDTMKHVVATGDKRAEQALNDVIASVIGVTRHARPVTLLTANAKAR